MTTVSPESPEQRALRDAENPSYIDLHLDRVRPGSRAYEVLKRVVVGVYSDGFIHAGNLAYLAIVTLFPFFIVAAAIASVFGQNAETARAVGSFLHVLPRDVADLLRKPIADVLAARTGGLLWLGAIVGLWTVGSFIETIRDVFRRAYGTQFSKPFWQYRLGSVAVIIGSVVLALVAFLIQGVLTAAEQFIYRLMPWTEGLAALVGLSRLIPGAIMFGALYMLFYSVTPSKYRYGNCRKWPGALFTTLWWVSATALLPWVLGQLGGYGATYGGLAGTVVTLLFFFIIGLGITIAAHLNAALAETRAPELREPTTTEAPVAAT